MKITEVVYYSITLDNLVIIELSDIGSSLISEFGVDPAINIKALKTNLNLVMLDVTFIKSGVYDKTYTV